MKLEKWNINEFLLFKVMKHNMTYNNNSDFDQKHMEFSFVFLLMLLFLFWSNLVWDCWRNNYCTVAIALLSSIDTSVVHKSTFTVDCVFPLCKSSFVEIQPANWPGFFYLVVSESVAHAKCRYVLCHIAYSSSKVFGVFFWFGVFFLFSFLICVVIWHLLFDIKHKMLPSHKFLLLSSIFLLPFSCFTRNKYWNTPVSVIWQSGRSCFTPASLSLLSQFITQE